jgi:RNA polymerase sigma-70 factor (ECF subfamily)
MLPGAGESPEQIMERHAMRDWLWSAIDELTPALRTTVLLRHFSARVSSYEQIAAVCGVPVGTVRSRLSQARVKLAAASRHDALETLAAAERGEFGKVLSERWSPDGADRHGRLGPSPLTPERLHARALHAGPHRAARPSRTTGNS